MKFHIYSIVLIFVYSNIQAQTNLFPLFYKNDSSYLKQCTYIADELKLIEQFNNVHRFKNTSYLKLNKDSAEFKIYRLNGICLAGKGLYNIKDSIIYITTVLPDKDYYPKFENVGQSDLNRKLLIEVYTPDNERIQRFRIIIRGKNLYHEEKSDNGICEIDLHIFKRPISIEIRAFNDSNQKSFVSLEIPCNTIKTDKIKVYLTNIIWIRNRIEKFKVEKSGDSYCVTGPLQDKPKSKLKFNLKYGFYRIVSAHSYSRSITMCSE
jgi:hypothetical protein